MFPTYLELGFDHILDLNGYDHILFLITLCALFSLKEWKQVLILVTAFTIGHSITLALSALDHISIDSSLIELLIPITILITAVSNLLIWPHASGRWQPKYFIALFFGFIHGMGFSNYFKALLGREADIIVPLLAFNIGVELGQICIVAGILLINFVIVQRAGLRQKTWSVVISSVAILLSIIMIAQRIN